MYRVVGFLKNVQPERLVNRLLINYPDLKYHARIFGYDIELSGDNFELLIQTYNEVEYNIDLSFDGQKDELIKILNTFKKVLLS